eukprot:3010994-Prymnesium_polylepis.1
MRSDSSSWLRERVSTVLCTVYSRQHCTILSSAARSMRRRKATTRTPYIFRSSFWSTMYRYHARNGILR